MKKLLVLAGIILSISCVFARDEYTYSPAYIQHLKNCSPYTDEYVANVPTGDETSPYLKMKSTEQIIGWLNGKCITKSTIVNLDLDQKVMVIKCGYSKEQLNSIIEKMKTVNKDASEEAKQILSDEMVKIIEDGSSCKVKNYLEEQNQD